MFNITARIQVNKETFFANIMM